MESTSKPSAEPRAAKDVAPFLKQLRAMLDGEHSTVLRWTANGCAFEIIDMEQMMVHVLPKYFKHRKYTSFQRQLNYFSFRKWTKSKATVCTFSNEFFRRDKPELAWRITRKKTVHNVTIQHQKHSPVGRSLQPAPPSIETLPDAPDHQPTSPPFVPHPVAIHVPGMLCVQALSSGSFPSPTDLSMVLKAHDFATSVIEPTSILAPPAEPLEPFEWFDILLPFEDRVDEQPYTPPHAYPVPHVAFGLLDNSLRTVRMYDHPTL